jgi:hypothetical protein
MSVQQWASLIVSVLAILTAIGTGARWMIKHYFFELKTNGGSSMRDDVIANKKGLERVEEKQDKQGERIDEIYRLLLTRG